MKGAGCDTIFLVDWRYILVALRVGATATKTILDGCKAKLKG
jgi:hypothetical protein